MLRINPVPVVCVIQGMEPHCSFSEGIYVQCIANDTWRIECTYPGLSAPVAVQLLSSGTGGKSLPLAGLIAAWALSSQLGQLSLPSLRGR